MPTCPPQHHPPGGRFGLISGLIGLALCVSQTIQGHVNARNERERMQEAHEEKMHFLHEMHRQQLHHKEREIEREREKGREHLEIGKGGAVEKGKGGAVEKGNENENGDQRVMAVEGVRNDGVADRGVGAAGE